MIIRAAHVARTELGLRFCPSAPHRCGADYVRRFQPVQQIEAQMLAMVLALAVTQGPVTPAAPLRYRLEAKTVAQQDPAGVGNEMKSGSLTTTAIISVTLTDSAEGQIARVTVDSMKLEPTGAMTLSLPLTAAVAAADTVRGAFVRAYTVRGVVRGTAQASSPHPALATIFQAMPVLFPGLRSGIKVGDSWADTTRINNDISNGHQTGQVIATWRVTGIENGGFVLDGAATTTVTTNGQNGQSLHVTGSSKEHLVMAGRGPTRSASIESSNNVTMSSTQAAAPVVGRNTGSLKLTPLP
jgi:hypothetical protein